MNKKTTGELLDAMNNYDKYEKYSTDLSEHMAETQTGTVLEELLAKHALKKADIIAASGIEPHYAYQIFSGRKTPGRDKLIMLLCAMRLELEEIQSVLKLTGNATLYPKLKRDNAIIFGIVKHKTVMQINELLYELKAELLE